jgi:hypothetical protein
VKNVYQNIFHESGHVCSHVPFVLYNTSFFSRSIALLPVHTKALFDLLQQAARRQTHGRAFIDSNKEQIDLLSLLTNYESSVLPVIGMLPTTITADRVSTDNDSNLNAIVTETTTVSTEELASVTNQLNTLMIDEPTDMFTTIIITESRTISTTDDQNSIQTIESVTELPFTNTSNEFEASTESVARQLPDLTTSILYQTTASSTMTTTSSESENKLCQRILSQMLLKTLPSTVYLSKVSSSERKTVDAFLAWLRQYFDSSLAKN